MVLLLFIVTPIVGVCNCSIFCCTLLYVHSSFSIILMGKRELVALLNMSSWCIVMVKQLFLAVPRGCLRFVIVVFPDHNHLLFMYLFKNIYYYILTICQRNNGYIESYKTRTCIYIIGPGYDKRYLMAVLMKI